MKYLVPGVLLLVVISVALVGELKTRQPVIGSDSRGRVFTAQRLLMGTEFKVTVWASREDSGIAMRRIGEVFDELAGIEERISSWLPESETSRVNRAAGNESVPVGADLGELLIRSIHWAEKTGGAFDVTGGALFELWEQARERGVLPSPEEVDSRRALIGYQHLQVSNGRVRLDKAGMKLGFGGIAKGYAADRAADLLQSKGLSHVLIDAGGDLLARGRRGDHPWNVAVRHPRRSGFLGVLEAKGCAIASSGDYERYSVIGGQRYSHLVDLRTGWPATHLTGVTVIARSATDADALATALFVMEASQGLELVETLPGVEAILVDGDGELTLSTGLLLRNGRLTVDWQ